jgi:hypothetical protein
MCNCGINHLFMATCQVNQIGSVTEAAFRGWHSLTVLAGELLDGSRKRTKKVRQKSGVETAGKCLQSNRWASLLWPMTSNDNILSFSSNSHGPHILVIFGAGSPIGIFHMFSCYPITPRGLVFSLWMVNWCVESPLFIGGILIVFVGLYNVIHNDRRWIMD